MHIQITFVGSVWLVILDHTSYCQQSSLPIAIVKQLLSQLLCVNLLLTIIFTTPDKPTYRHSGKICSPLLNESFQTFLDFHPVSALDLTHLSLTVTSINLKCLSYVFPMLGSSMSRCIFTLKKRRQKICTYR